MPLVTMGVASKPASLQPSANALTKELAVVTLATLLAIAPSLVNRVETVSTAVSLGGSCLLPCIDGTLMGYSHSKADCTNPRVFTGTCRLCSKEGHPASECPDKPPEICKNCKKEGQYRCPVEKSDMLPVVD